MQQNIQHNLQQLLQKDMDRKAFIKHVGIGFVALTGVAAAVKSLTQFNGGAKPVQNFGYGASAYGGSKPSSVSSQR